MFHGSDRSAAFLVRLADTLRRLSDPRDIIGAAEEALGRELGVSRVGYGEADPTGRYFTVERNWTDGSVAHSIGVHDLAGFGPEIHDALKRGTTLVVGDVTRDERTNSPERLAAFAFIETAAAVTVSLIRNGRLTAALYVHDRTPRTWHPAEVQLIEDAAERLWDTVERANTEAKLRLERDRTREILDTMGEGFVLIGPDFEVLDINTEALRIEGRPRDSIVGKSFWDAWPGSENAALGQLCKTAMAQRVPASLEHRYVWPDGHAAWLEARVFPVRDGLALFTRDISARKEADERLRASEAKLRQIADNLPALIGYVDREQRYRFNNRSYEAWIGRTPESLLGVRLRDAVGPEAYERVRPFVEAALAGERSHHEWWASFPTGRRYVRSDYIPDRTEDGTVVGFHVLASDLSEFKRSEEALAESEARLRAVIEQMPVGVILADLPSGELLTSNRKAADLMGHPLLGGSAESYGQYGGLHPDGTPYRAEEYPLGRTVLKGETVEDEVVRYRRADGRITFLAVNSTFIRNTRGEPGLAVCTFSDISQRKEAEEHQRLLINELNHRVKNTLATVQSIASQTLRSAATPEAAKEALESRLMAMSRAHDVLTRENWEAASLHEIVAQAMEPYAGSGTSRIAFAGPALRIEPRMALALAMAFQELATNAVKYGALSNETGEIGIRWSVEGTHTDLRLHLTWEETGGPTVHPPKRRGFGTRLIERSLAHDLAGRATVDFAPTGVVCTVDAPLAEAAPQPWTPTA